MQDVWIFSRVFAGLHEDSRTTVKSLTFQKGSLYNVRPTATWMEKGSRAYRHTVLRPATLNPVLGDNVEQAGEIRPKLHLLGLGFRRFRGRLPKPRKTLALQISTAADAALHWQRFGARDRCRNRTKPSSAMPCPLPW